MSRGVCGGSGGCAGVRDWRLLFPGSCHVRGERPGGSGTGRSPAARGGAGGVLEVAGREPDDRGGGKREPGVVRGIRLFRSVPWSGSSRCGQCRWLHSSLRLSPAVEGRGRMGRVRVRGGGQAGSIRGRPRRRVGRRGRNLATSRLAAGQGKLFMPPARPGSPAVGPGGPGQAADLPVAHPVEDQGQQPAGGGDLGDVPGFLPAAGDDGLLDSAGHRVRAGRAGWPRSAPSAAAAIPAW